MFLTGINTRTLAMLSQRLIGRKISHSQVSRAHQELSEAVVTWRERDLSEEIYKYLYIDGGNFKMRIHGSIKLVPVLVVIGVSQEGFQGIRFQLERVFQGSQKERIVR